MTRPHAQTLAQKLIARAAGVQHVAVGEVVTCGVDLAMFTTRQGLADSSPCWTS